MRKRDQAHKSEVFSWIKMLVIALLLVFLARHFLFSPFVVHGASMMPTLHNDDKLIVNKLGATVGTPDRFDIIVFQAPDEDARYVKRVIGLPGDEIVYKDDTLYINGKKYKEPYLKKYKEQLPLPSSKLTGDFTLKEITGKTRVPKDKLFVLGDNRQVSKDSRYFGFIPKDSVIGVVDVRYWPFSDFEWMSRL